MFWTIFTMLLILWAVGLVSGAAISGFIHLLLVAAVVMMLIRLVQGRNPV